MDKYGHDGLYAPGSERAVSYRIFTAQGTQYAMCPSSFSSILSILSVFSAHGIGSAPAIPQIIGKPGNNPNKSLFSP